jgi:DNA-binding MarR family transcriptional regulator
LKKTPKTLDLKSTARYAYDGLGRVIHERGRLSLMTSLSTHPKGLTFNELKSLCALTDGNLNRHLQVLVESKLVVVTKVSDRNRRQTCIRITALGRKRFIEYLAVLEQLLEDAKARERSEAIAKIPRPHPAP